MTPDELAAHQAALRGSLGALNVEMDDALDTLEQIARNAKYQEAHIASRAQTILAVLAAPYEDPRDTVVGDIVAGAPEPNPSPLGA